MFPETLSNSTSLSEEASGSSGTRIQDLTSLNPIYSSAISPPHQQPEKIKKKRNLPGNPDPDAEVIALSPKTLLATNRFVCEICNKGFQRDQNLQLHRRGHNLPWKLRQRSSTEIRKRVYVCPELSCVHHHPSRALGDLTGIKKHFCRKHGEKKWKCEKCSKKYAVQSDWKAHSKTCGTKEYRCDCGTLFSRKDSFITHRAFCDALAEESARLISNNPNLTTTNNPITPDHHPLPLPLHLQHQQNPPSSLIFPFPTQHQQNLFPNNNPPLPTPMSLITSSWNNPPVDHHQNPNNHNNSIQNQNPNQIKPETHHQYQNINTTPTSLSSFFQEQPPPPTTPSAHKPLIAPIFLEHTNNNVMMSNTNTAAHMSATALLQKAANVGPTAIGGTAGGSTLQTQSVGHMGSSSMTRLQMDELGTVSHHMGLGSSSTTGISPDYLQGFPTSSNLATWQKNDRLTRDFLGLAAGDHHSVSVTNGVDRGGGGGGGAERSQLNANVNVRDLLTFAGGVDFQTYDRDHSLLKPSGFGFAGAWGDC
ncbi:zinc finger protein [Macleaya cordata]|uniref:Zinc finger protein n=1 Tax=Macleaya cordata TaxID=56857 RepID=A0A200Q4P2_MACCD|nr:zinc finger protein [Macleaya cordata]